MRSDPKTRMIDARELRLTSAALSLEAPTMPYRREQLVLPTEARPEAAHVAHVASALPPAQAKTQLVSADALYAVARGDPAAPPSTPAPPASAIRVTWATAVKQRAPLIIAPIIVGVIALFATWSLSAPPTRPAALVARATEGALRPPAKQAPGSVARPDPRALPSRISAIAPPAVPAVHPLSDRSPRGAVEALAAGRPDEAILAYRSLAPAPESSLGVVLRLLEAEAARRAHAEGDR